MDDAKKVAELATVASPQGSRAAAHKTSHWLVPAVGLALTVGGGLAIWWWLTPGAPVQYGTRQVSRGHVVRTVISSGTVNPVITVQVGSYVSGVIQARYCDYNTR